MQFRPAIASLIVGAMVVLASAACGGSASGTTNTTTMVPPSPAPTTPATTTEAPDTTLVESVCLSGDMPFVDSGTVAGLGDGEGDAAQLAAVRWAAHRGCERVVIDLLTVEAVPATSVGESSVTILDGTGVIRVVLPTAVRTTGIADSLLEGDLAQRAFVVRLDAATLAVDIHTATSVPIRTRAFTVDAPARIVVDLAPAAEGGAPVVTPPLIGPNVVVLSPLGAEVAYPVRVTGYARTFEANVIGRILSDGEVATEAFTTAAAWLDAWGSFSLDLPVGPSGPIRLFVGEDDARNGSPRGVSVDMMVP